MSNIPCGICLLILYRCGYVILEYGYFVKNRYKYGGIFCTYKQSGNYRGILKEIFMMRNFVYLDYLINTNESIRK